MHTPSRICIFYKTEAFSTLCRAIEEKTYRHGTVFSWFPGGMEGAVKAYQNKEKASLSMIEAPSCPEKMLHGVRAIQQQTKTLENIFLVGTIDRTETYRQLMRQGVGEYVSLPISVDNMMTLFQDLLARLSLLQEGKMIAVIGVRGGTGASTLCHNMAWFASQEGAPDKEKNTLLIDCERSYGGVSSNLLKDTGNKHGGIQEACKEWDRLDPNYLEQLCYDYDSFSILPSIPIEGEQPFSPRTLAPLVHVCQVRFSNIFLDIPHGWEPWQRYLVTNAYRTVLVGLPCIASIQALHRIIPMFLEENMRFHIVINRMGQEHSLSQKDVCSLLSKYRQHLLFVPSASLFHMAHNLGTVAARLEPEHSVWKTMAPLLPTKKFPTKKFPTKKFPTKKLSALQKPPARASFFTHIERWLPV